MLVFFAVTLSIFGLVNYYIARRGAQALAAHPRARTAFLVLFIALALSYPIGRLIHSFARDNPPVWLENVGSFHMVIMLYGFLGVLAVDLVRLIDSFFPFLPRVLRAQPGRTGAAVFVVAAAATAVAIVAGAWNSARPRLVDLETHLPRKSGTTDRLTAVLASDLHLGSIIGRSRLEKVVGRINALHPDVVFFAGDIVDESVTGRREVELSEIMGTLKTRFGVFTVPGNHETYAGLDRTRACFKNCGLTMLEDQAVRVADAFVLAGRRDPSSLRPGERRLGIAEILASEGLDDSLPVVLLDHQPGHLEQAEQAGVGLQLSGHTHAGQLFPLNIVNRFFWELNWGFLRKGSTLYYVTSGVGTWGPPVRTGSRAEIVRIELRFDRPAGSGVREADH